MKSTVAAQAATGVNSTMKKIWGFGGSGSANKSGSGSTTPPSSASNGLPSPTKTTFDTSFALPTYSHPPPSHEQIHIFRASDSPTSSRYAVCPVYCLARLRAVCEFWTYVRVIERGLLLEEGFRFVQGRGKPQGGTRSASQSVEGLGLSGGDVGGGKSERVVLGEDKGGFGGGRRESLQLNAGKVPEEFVMDGGELPAEEEEDEMEKKEEIRDEEPKVVVEQPAAEESKTEEEPAKVEEEPKGEQQNGDAHHSEEDKKDDKSSVPSSPEVSMSPNPNKPPVPKRSAARQSGSTTPILGSTPSSPTVDNPLASSSEAPKLPPRRPGVSTSGLAPPAPPRHPAMNRSNSDLVASNGDIVSASMGWEDRCWSEVIRLKESVFWARVAAVTADGEQVASRLTKVKMDGSH